MSTDNERISVDFSDTSIYEDSYAEDHAGTAEFEFIKNSDLYKAVRANMGGILDVDTALASAVREMIPSHLDMVEYGFNVIEGEDGPENITYSAVEYMNNQYEAEIAAILRTGEAPFDPLSEIDLDLD